MKRFTFRRGALAFAVAACGSAAYAQSPCDQDIRQLEQEIQQGHIEPQQQSAVRDLLRAAEQNPDDCNVYISRAEEVMNRQHSGQPQGMEPETAQPQTSQPQVSQSAQQQTAQQQTAQQQDRQQQAAETDRTMDIQVDQAPAQVDVQTRSPGIVVKQQPAQVTVEQPPPKVEITQHEPEVTVQQPEPQVTVNQAQPEVDVSQSEPQVEVEQSEPNVRVVQPEATATVQRDQTQSAGTQSVAQSQSGTAEAAFDLEEVQGSQALSSTGEDIGEVQEFVRSRSDGSAHALIDVGGLLGIGGRTVAIPLDQVTLNQDGQLQTPYSEDQLEQMEEYDQERYEEIPESEFAALEAELRSPETQLQ